MAPTFELVERRTKKETRFKTMVLSLPAGLLGEAAWLYEPSGLAWSRY